MAGIVVIGIGNPLRRDDGFGLKAIEELQRVGLAKDVDFVHCQQLYPELAEKISGAMLAIFIDAESNGIAGEMRCYPIEPACGDMGAMAHHLDPNAVLALAQEIYGRRPEALVVSVTGEDFGYGETLSAPVAATLESVVQRVRGIILSDACRL